MQVTLTEVHDAVPLPPTRRAPCFQHTSFLPQPRSPLSAAPQKGRGQTRQPLRPTCASSLLPTHTCAGSLLAPLTPTDHAPPGLTSTRISMIFCMVDSGKQYAAKHRADALRVHEQISALTRDLLRMVSSPQQVLVCASGMGRTGQLVRVRRLHNRGFEAACHRGLDGFGAM